MKTDETVKISEPPVQRLTTVRQGSHCELVGITNGPGRGPGRGHGRRRQRFGERRHGKSWTQKIHHKRSYREMMGRLLDLGLTKGCVFEVVQISRNGPVLVEVRGTRIALGHGIASRLLVREVISPQ
ncbi:MAG: FeoA family protein [Candidatus Thorarchaeota archaeon]